MNELTKAIFAVLIGTLLGGLVILALVISTGCSNKIVLPTYNPSDILDNMEDLKESYLIRLHDENGKFFCSAVVISKSYALTAAHCLMTDRVISVHTNNNKDLGTKAKRASASPRGDIGAITGDFSAYNVAALTTTMTDTLTTILSSHRLLACGFPWGGVATCISFRKPTPFGFQIAGQTAFYPGMSGGPVLDMDTMRVVGVAAAMSGDMGIFSPTIEIFSQLDIPVEK